MPRSVQTRLTRAAGLLYLIIIICGLSSELLLRGPLLVEGDAALTVANIEAALTGFRLSLLLDLAMALSDVALAGLLYLLLTPVSPVLALLATIFRLVQAAVLGANLLNQAMALQRLSVAGDLPGRDLLVQSSLAVQAQGYDLGLAFFAFTCLFIALIILHNPIAPRALGWLMSAAAGVYLAGAALRILALSVVSLIEPAYLVAVAAELWFCLWLLTSRQGATRRPG